MNRTLATSVMFLLMSGTALASPMTERPDLPPPQIVAKLLEESPAVQSAMSGIDLGKANKRKLDSGPYEFNLSATGQQRRIKDANKRYDEWNIGLDRPLRIPGKGGIDSDIGNAGMHAANFAYNDAYHETARTLLSEWFGWVKAKSEVAQWQEQVKTLNRQSEVVAKREKLGDAATLETSMAQAASAQADASLKQAEARLQIAASTLLQNYPGLNLPENITVGEPEPVEGSLETWSARILNNNHELERARAESLQAKLQAERARLDLIPDPTIGVQMGSEQGGNERFIGLRLSIPIPGSSVRSAESEAASAQASIAAQKKALTSRAIMNNIATVYANAVSGYKSWQSAKVAMNSINQNVTKMARAYELGEVGLSDLLTAQRLRAESSLTSNATRIEAIEARYRLLLDSHQLWLPQREEAKPADKQETRAEELQKVQPQTLPSDMPVKQTATAPEKTPEAVATTTQPILLLKPPANAASAPPVEAPAASLALPWQTVPSDSIATKNKEKGL